MTDKQGQLYQYLSDNGLIDETKESFILGLQDEDNRKQLWKYLKDSGLTEDDEETFVQHLNPQPQQQQPQHDPEQPRIPTQEQALVKDYAPSQEFARVKSPDSTFEKDDQYIVKHESAGDTNAVNTNTDGTSDRGERQINDRWVNQVGPSYKIAQDGTDDVVYDIVQRTGRKMYPNWDEIDDAGRQAYLHDPVFNKAVAKVIHDNRGLTQWAEQTQERVKADQDSLVADPIEATTIVKDDLISADDNAILQQAQSRSPVLAQHDYIIERVDRRSPHGGWIEFLPPGETGDGTEPGNETGQPLIRLYSDAPTDPAKLEEAIYGDMLHQLSDTDWYWRDLRDRYMDGRPENIVAMDEKAYEMSGDERPFDQWMDVSRADAHIRAGILDYENWRDVNRSPEQEEILEEMKHYLSTGERQSASTPFGALQLTQMLVADSTKSDDDPSKLGHQMILMESKKRLALYNETIAREKTKALDQGGVKALKQIQSNESAIDKDQNLDPQTKSQAKIESASEVNRQIFGGGSGKYGLARKEIPDDDPVPKPQGGKYGWMSDELYAMEQKKKYKPPPEYDIKTHTKKTEQQDLESQYSEKVKEHQDFTERVIPEQVAILNAIESQINEWATYDEENDTWMVHEEDKLEKVRTLQEEYRVLADELFKQEEAILSSANIFGKDLEKLAGLDAEEIESVYKPSLEVIEDLRSRQATLVQDGVEYAFFDILNNRFVLNSAQIELLENPEKQYTEHHKRPWWYVKVNTSTGEISEEDKITFDDAWVMQDKSKIIPFWSGVSSSYEMARLLTLSIKADKDPDSLTPEEADFLLNTFDHMNRMRTTGAMAFDIGFNSIPFAVEFGVAGGVTQATAKAGAKILAKYMKGKAVTMIPKLTQIAGATGKYTGALTLGGAGTFALKTGGRYVAGEMSGRIESDKLRRMSGNIVVMDEYFEGGDIGKPTFHRLSKGEEKEIAQYKARLGYLGEIISEETGWILTSMTRKARNIAVRGAVVNTLSKTYNVTPGSIRAYMKSAGIGNPLEESFEERINEFYSAWIVENKEYEAPTWQQIRAEFMGFIPMSGLGTAGAMYQEKGRGKAYRESLKVEEELIQQTEALKQMSPAEVKDSQADAEKRINEAIEEGDQEAVLDVLDDVVQEQTRIPAEVEKKMIGGKVKTWMVSVKDQFGEVLQWAGFDKESEAIEYEKSVVESIAKIQKEKGGAVQQRLVDLKDQFEQEPFFAGWWDRFSEKHPILKEMVQLQPKADEDQEGGPPVKESEAEVSFDQAEENMQMQMADAESQADQYKSIMGEMILNDKYVPESKVKGSPDMESSVEKLVDLANSYGMRNNKGGMHSARSLGKNNTERIAKIKTFLQENPDAHAQTGQKSGSLLIKRYTALSKQEQTPEVDQEKADILEAIYDKDISSFQTGEYSKFIKKIVDDPKFMRKEETKSVKSIAIKLANKNILDAGNVKEEDLKNKNINRATLQGFRNIIEMIEKGDVDVSGARDWYSEEVTKAMDILKAEFPEIASVPANEQFAKMVLAITSHGSNVKANWHMMNGLLKDYFETGKFRTKEFTYTHKKTGKEVTNDGTVYIDIDGKEKVVGGRYRTLVHNQLKDLENMVNEYGIHGAMMLMLTKTQGRKLGEKIGFKNITKRGDHFGAERFGPKIGPFFLNLNGISELPTLDQWWTRTWNRWMGTPLSKAGEMVETPRNKSERNAMTEALNRIAGKLTEAGYGEISPEEVQALLWYYEKDLYIQAGATPSELVSYGDVALERQNTLNEQSTTSANTKALAKSKEKGLAGSEEQGSGSEYTEDRVKEDGVGDREGDSEERGVQRSDQKTPRQVATPIPVGRSADGRIRPEDVYTISGNLDPSVDTTNDLKIYDLQPLVDSPQTTDRFLWDYGFKVEYFSFEDSPAKGGIDFRLPKLKTHGYNRGYVWIYDPVVEHGSFKDIEYTRSWRVFHEVGHGISEKFMEERYGPSRREGRLGYSHPGKRGKPPKQIDVTLRPLTLKESQRAVEWEDLAFRTQRILLEEYGIKISTDEFGQEYNTNISDALFRVLTGDFGNPGEYGYIPSTKPVSLKSVLRLLENQEKMIAEANGRVATVGVDLKTWKRIPDSEIRKEIKKKLEQENSRIRRVQGDKPMFMLNGLYGGSGASFSEYDLSFVGTGEGNRAFGWGMYFSSKNAIARWYAIKEAGEVIPRNYRIGPFQLIKDGKNVIGSADDIYQQKLKYKGIVNTKEDALVIWDILESVYYSWMKDITWAYQMNSDDHKIAEYQLFKKLKEKADQMQAGSRMANRQEAKEWNSAYYEIVINMANQVLADHQSTEPGSYVHIDYPRNRNVYEVSLGKNIDRELVLMDWDQSFKDQPKEIREKIWAQLEKEFPGKLDHFRLKNINPSEGYGGLHEISIGAGRILYKDLVQYLHPYRGEWAREKEASMFLKRAGIDGIVYQAEGGNSSARNYVVFDDALITIEDHVKFQRKEKQNVQNQNQTNREMQVGDLAVPYSGHTKEEAEQELEKRRKELKAWAKATGELEHRNEAGEVKPYDFDSWELSPMETESDQILSKITDLFGQKAIFFDSKGILPFRGVVMGDALMINNSVHNSDHSPIFAVGHELVHRLKIEHPDLYEKYKDFVASEVNNMDGVLRKYGTKYRLNKGDSDLIFEEFCSDVMADAMQEKDFWQRMYEYSPELMRSIMDIIERTLQQLNFISSEYSTREFINNFEAVVKMAGEVMGEYMVRQNPESTAFQKWFKKSQVVNENDEPMVMYHGTASKKVIQPKDEYEVVRSEADDFESFERTHDIGFHFGTVEQANRKIAPGDMEMLNDPRTIGKRILPVYLSIQNPLRLEEPEIGGDWGSAIQLHRQLHKLGFKGIPVHDYKLRLDSEHLPLLKAYLIEQGYDGIVYKNKYESPLRDKEGNITTSYELGEIDYQDSYIAFHPWQIKSIFNPGKYSSLNSKIMFMRGPSARFLRGEYFYAPTEQEVELLLGGMSAQDMPETEKEMEIREKQDKELGVESWLFTKSFEAVRDNMPGKKMSVLAIPNFLKKHGVSTEEIHWLGISDLIAEGKSQKIPKITKEELLWHISIQTPTINDMVFHSDAEQSEEFYSLTGDAINLQTWADDDTQHSGYQLDRLDDPSQKGYKEILLTIDHPKISNPPDSPVGHYDGYKSILVALRISERIGADGKKILFIEEAQSDWHDSAEKKRNKAIRMAMEDDANLTRKEANKLFPEDYGYTVSPTQDQINALGRLKQEKIEVMKNMRKLRVQAFLPNTEQPLTFYRSEGGYVVAGTINREDVFTPYQQDQHLFKVLDSWEMYPDLVDQGYGWGENTERLLKLMKENTIQKEVDAIWIEHIGKSKKAYYDYMKTVGYSGSLAEQYDPWESDGESLSMGEWLSTGAKIENRRVHGPGGGTRVHPFNIDLINIIEGEIGEKWENFFSEIITDVPPPAVTQEFLSERYLSGNADMVRSELQEEMKAVDGKLIILNHAMRSDGVADAPFKNQGWKRIALKRMMRWAIKNGFDTVAWTTGAQQVERWEADLRMKVDEIIYEPVIEPYKLQVRPAGTYADDSYILMGDGEDRRLYAPDEVFESADGEFRFVPVGFSLYHGPSQVEDKQHKTRVFHLYRKLEDGDWLKVNLMTHKQVRKLSRQKGGMEKLASSWAYKHLLPLDETRHFDATIDYSEESGWVQKITKAQKRKGDYYRGASINLEIGDVPTGYRLGHLMSMLEDVNMMKEDYTDNAKPGWVRIIPMKHHERLEEYDVPINGSTDIKQHRNVTLDAIVGSKIAKKIRKSVSMNRHNQEIPGTETISGDDLVIGGQKLRQQYDEVMVDIMNKLVKRYKTQVEKKQMMIGGRVPAEDPRLTHPELEPDQLPDWTSETTWGEIETGVHAVDLTDEMKEALSGPQPMFMRKEQPKVDPFINDMAQKFNEFGRPKKEDFIDLLKQEGVPKKALMKARKLFSAIKDKGLIEKGVVTQLEKRIGAIEFKQTELEKIIESADSPALKRKAKIDRTKLEQRIKDLVSGHRLGSTGKRTELGKLRHVVRDYAKENLPKDSLTRGQVLPLMTALKTLKSERELQVIFDKIDAIARKVNTTKAVSRIKKVVKSVKITKVSGKAKGKMTATHQIALDEIKRVLSLPIDEVEDEKELINRLALAENSEPDSEQDLFDDHGNRVLSPAEKLYILEVWGGLYAKDEKGLYVKSLDELLVALDKVEKFAIDGKTDHYIREIARKTKNRLTTKKAHKVIAGGRKVWGKQKSRTLGRDSSKMIQKMWDGLRGANAKLQSWSSLMDILSFHDQDSAPFESFLNQYFGKSLREADLSEQEGVRVKEMILNENAERIYGVSGRALVKILNKNEKVVEHDIEILIDALPPRFHGVVSADKNNVTKLKCSQNELAQYYMWLQDPKLEKTFRHMGWTDATILELEEALDPQVREFADYLLNEFYPEYYPEINNIYKEMFYVDLAKNPKYSHLAREHYGKDAGSDFETIENTSPKASVYSGHLIGRVDSSRPLMPTDMLSNVYAHIFQMEHFISHAKAVREIRAVFMSEPVRSAIEEFYGKPILKVIDQFIDDIARGGISHEKISKGMDFFISNFVKAKIGLKPVILLKQLASAPANLSEVPVPQFMYGMGEFFIHPYQALTILSESRLVRSRGKGFNRDVRALMRKSTSQRLANSRGFKDFMMGLAKLGDISAILMGGWSVYSYYYEQHINDKKLNPTGSEDEAHLFALDKFDQSAETWQQSGSIKNLSQIQRGGSTMKMFTMFLNSPIQYFQQGEAGIRGIVAGRGKVKDNTKRTLVAYVLLQGMFNIIAQGMKYDPDDDEFWWKLSIAWTRGIPVFGGALEWLLFRSYMYTLTPIQSVVPDMARAFQSGSNLYDAYTGKEKYSQEEIIKMGDDILDLIGTFSGIPYEGASGMIEGGYEAYKGEAEYPVQRALGYSNWALYGTNQPKQLLLAKAVEHNHTEDQYWDNVVKYYKDKGKSYKYIKSQEKNTRRKYRYTKSFKKNDDVTEIIRAQSNEDKVRLLIYLRSQMDDNEFKKLWMKMRSERHGKVVSDNVNTQVKKQKWANQ